MSRPIDLTEYLFIGGPEDGKYIETPGCAHHEVLIDSLPPRLGQPYREHRAVYHRCAMVTDSSPTHVTVSYVYVIDGMPDSEARKRVRRVHDAAR